MLFRAADGAADQLGVEASSVGQLDRDLLRAVDHMIVGDDDAVPVGDEARTHRERRGDHRTHETVSENRRREGSEHVRVLHLDPKSA